MKYIGIDPGTKGGASVLCENGILSTFQSKGVEVKDLIEMFEWLLLHRKDSIVVVEQVTGYIPSEKGRKGNTQPGSRMFQFGLSYGAWLALLISLDFQEGITFHRVAPRVWQRSLGLGRPTEMSRQKWKSELARAAKKRYPREKLTGQTADATLLATYAKLHYSG